MAFRALHDPERMSGVNAEGAYELAMAAYGDVHKAKKIARNVAMERMRRNLPA